MSSKEQKQQRALAVGGIFGIVLGAVLMTAPTGLSFVGWLIFTAGSLAVFGALSLR
jgi:hypothetical protein